MSSLEDLLNKSIPELSELYVRRQRPVPKGLLEALDVDKRQGAQQLAKRIRSRYRDNRSEGQRLHCLLRFEIELWSQGYGFIAGVDEAGMAPLAGPVVAGAVILPQNYKLRGLNDSKKILDPEKRDELALQIKQDAVCWSVGIAEVEEIDKINIYHAGLLAMQRAVQGLSAQPEFILVDARRIPNCQTPQRGIIRGDALSASIAAASIIAKTTRDAHMMELDQIYSGYGPRHSQRLSHSRTLSRLEGSRSPSDPSSQLRTRATGAWPGPDPARAIRPHPRRRDRRARHDNGNFCVTVKETL
jgi:ribonuclease HII